MGLLFGALLPACTIALPLLKTWFNILLIIILYDPAWGWGFHGVLFSLIVWVIGQEMVIAAIVVLWLLAVRGVGWVTGWTKLLIVTILGIAMCWSLGIVASTIIHWHEPPHDWLPNTVLWRDEVRRMACVLAGMIAASLGYLVHFARAR